ncbi:Xenobiotic-transporting ATPase [Desulfurobacterium thermolithotrophum DSM 11699]|uniref:Xenobiotic-transporting ATPase n=1 Tax=Desulfurobacterium thermolithotrophum (strain DSM 11699 / BSA) TaxID=868864 RepID=F0S2U3_DESTD|nr:ABC transporter ATP-binding protein [Desulfurobacterium thermolithotrophum]ADY73165.1 Xenobiotic-transporting ATPase [Desulfurobacterium thermolithotrophum DSM 11699]
MMEDIKKVSFPWWILKYLKDMKLLFAVAFITMFLHAGITSYLAYFVKDIVNTVFVSKNERMINLIPLILLGLVLIKGIVYFINYYTMAYIGQSVIAKLREELYEKILKLPLDQFWESPGTFVSKVINDTSLLQDFTSRQIATFLRNLLTAIGLIIVVFYLDFKLAFFGLIGLPLIGFMISETGKRIKRYTDRMQDKLAAITNHLFEGARNIREIKLLGLEEKLLKLFQKDNYKYFKEFMKIRKIEGIYPSVVELTASIIVGLLMLYGGKKIIAGELTAGDFFSFIIALVMAYDPIRKLGREYNKIQQSASVAERIRKILELPDEYHLKDGSRELKEPINFLYFNNIYFKYPKSEDFILKGIDFLFEKGKKYAIVGKSGSGKSTLINLIPRFYDPTKGNIEVNGINLKDFKLKSLRRKIGVVSQDIIVFRGTIKENIALGNPGVSFDEIVKAAKIANIHDFIVSLPKGYDTLIGEGGIQLSGGQKQRIAIARAVLKNPDILILDEATSALDSETEAAVQKALDEKFKDKILIAIAHRLSTIINSDLIIFLKEGKIIGVGSHEELYANLEEYRKLCDIQFRISLK